MAERRRQLEETAQVLRSRLSQLRNRRVSDIQRPMHEVAVAAVRASLTQVGQQLTRISLY